MARVTVEQSQQDLSKPKGFRMFNYEPGGLYHVLFLGEQLGDNKEPIMYMNYTHNVKKDGKGFEARCASEHFNLDGVIVVDENGELVKDPKTGRPINDGTCPYCEVLELHNKYVFAKRTEWMEANPNATKAEIKEQTKKLFSTAPVTQPAKRRVLIVAVFELDEKGKVKTDKEGNRIYSIQAMRMSENQFSKKLLEQAEIKKMSLDEESDGGIAWHEYYFKYPNADNKMLSAKDMSITPVATEIINSDPALKARLKEEVDELDLDALEDLMYIFKLKTLEEMERDVAPLKSRIPTDRVLDDKEIKEALDEMGEDDIVTDDEISDIMGGDKPAKGESSFDIGVTDADIDGLM